jgi:hypothetical protein
MIGDLGAVVDIDTWKTAGDINHSYRRGITHNVAAAPKCRTRSDILEPKKALNILVVFVAGSTFTLAIVLGCSHPPVE